MWDSVGWLVALASPRLGLIGLDSRQNVEKVNLVWNVNMQVGFTTHWLSGFWLLEIHCVKLEVCFLAISQLVLGQIQKVRSVLKTTGSENFKTVPTFDIWPNRSWDIWG